ncbi:MAG: glycyl-radical enzyme activating protein [Myxococcota bacterium]|nr:glycyl-radical enzyme activating protein [Myxococcota bacterium]
MSIFLKGCPLACAWCHNPESQSPAPEIFFFRDRCNNCGACVEICPGERLEYPGPAVFPQCTACGSCVDVCVSEARKLIGKRIGVSELMTMIERERPFFDQSGGGVTFTGGEPLMQPEFLSACLAACKERSIHTAVDTCGFGDEAVISNIARIADLILFDLKIMDDVLHRKHTGVSVNGILRNLKAIDASGAQVWIRFPLVPGINDGEENIEAVGAFVSCLSHTRKLHVLPFHPMGLHKTRTRHPFRLCEGIERPSLEAVKKAAQQLARFGLEVFTP